MQRRIIEHLKFYWYPLHEINILDHFNHKHVINFTFGSVKIIIVNSSKIIHTNPSIIHRKKKECDFLNNKTYLDIRIISDNLNIKEREILVCDIIHL